MRKLGVVRPVCSTILCVLVIFPNILTAGNTDSPYQLTKQWQTQRDLRVPESILYDQHRNLLYVSNINGTPTEKNGQGFISKVTVDGEIVELKWVAGLNAPKGSALFDDTLYVSDIDQLIAVDLRTGKIENRYPAEGALFLNDVAADADGNVYVSDTSDANSGIYKLTQGRLTKWFYGPEIKNPNGLYMEGDRLIVGNSRDGAIKAVNLDNKAVTVIAKVGSAIDGLRSDGRGNYFVSDWQGRTSIVDASGRTRVLVDTRAEKINAADLEYIESMQLLLIPTFFDNRVVAYKVVNRT